MKVLINPMRCISFFIILIASRSVYAQKEVYRHRVFWTKTEINQLYPNNYGWGADVVVRSKNEQAKGGMFDHPNRQSFRLWMHYKPSALSRFSFSPVASF